MHSTWLIQIALLAWLFLGEELTFPNVVGLLAVALGVLIIQVSSSSQHENS